jgi:NAD(P)-dependent dehydrogenase (short-subunit alcohol dehydrogenase family)
MVPIKEYRLSCLFNCAERHGVAADISDPEAWAASARAAEASFGEVDIVVNNAAFYPTTRSITSILKPGAKRCPSISLLFLVSRAICSGDTTRRFRDAS